MNGRELEEQAAQLQRFIDEAGWPAVCEAFRREIEQRDVDELRVFVAELRVAQNRSPAGPPTDSRLPIARRFMLLVLAIGAVILLALIIGWLDHPVTAPMDPGTPSMVTTIGGGR